MKKLMTMIAAVGMAFGLFAETQFSSVDFSQSYWEGKTFSPLMTDQGEEAPAEGSVTRFWSYADDQFDGELTLNEGVLQVRSGQKVLSRNFSGLLSTDPINAAATAVAAGDDGLFIDMNLNLAGQALDTAPTAADLTGAKLAIFALDTTDLVEGTEKAAETNLWVIGGYVKNDQGAIGARAFKLQVYSASGDPVDIDSNFLAVNHRVTLKAYKTVTAGEYDPGFLLLIDENKFCKVVGYADANEDGVFDVLNPTTPSEEAMSWDYLGANFAANAKVAFRYTARNLLLSLSCGTDSDSSFKSVDFKGNANLNTLALNATVPTDLTELFIDAYTLNVVKGNGITSLTVGGTAVETGAIPFTPSASLAVVATYDTGFSYAANKFTLDGTAVTDVVVEGNTATATITPADCATLSVAGFKQIAMVDIGGVLTPVESFAEALALIGSGTGKITLTADAELDDGEVLSINEGTVTLDLAGKTITGGGDGESATTVIMNAGALTITNSTDTIGKIVPTDDSVAAVWNVGGTVAIQAGIYEGDVVEVTEVVGQCNITATAGSFKKSDVMTQEAVEAFVKDETLEVADDDDYWKVQEKQTAKGTVIFICEKNGAEYSRVTNDTYDVGTTIAKADFPTFDLDSDVWTLTWNQDSVTVAETETEVTATATIEFTGEGTEAAPYQIASAVDFKKVQAAVADGENFAEKFLVLANDVDMSGIAWTGIGAYNGGSTDLSPDFRGTLNGAGYAIQNITFARGEYYGFFNQLENATISNITFNVAGFAAGEATSYGAGVVANWVKGTTFDHVTVTGTLEGSHNVAGIAIKACGGTTFKDCVNNATITCTGSRRAGGLVGFESSTSGGVHFIRCTNNGNVTAKYADSADYAIGGIMAAANGQSITFEDCANYGTVAFSTEVTGAVRKGAFLGIVQNQKITATGNNKMKIIEGLDAIGTLSGTATETGFDYATEITDTQVTFSVLAEGDTATTFTLMKDGLTPTFELSAEGKKIAFNTNLHEAVAFAITAANDLKVEEAAAEGIVTFTAVAAQTDPIPPLPVNPTADDVNNAVDKANFADTTVKAMIGGDPAKYAAFKTWAGTLTGGEQSAVDSLHSADSFQLGLTALLENDPVAEIKTIAKTSDTALTLTFEIKDGAAGNAVAVADAAKTYVASLVKCSKDVGFTAGQELAAVVTVTVEGTTLTATVALPAAQPAAFMKVATK